MIRSTSKTDLHVILGAGPVGRTLAHALTEQGKKVRLVSRSGRADGLPRTIETRAADLTNATESARVMADAGTIYHCAAPAYQHWVRDFPTLQKGIVAGASTVDAPLVMLDNLYGYGVAGNLTEDLPMTATGPKGRLRADLARDLIAAHEAGQIKATIARAADFVGPEARMTALGARFWPQLLQSKTIQWFGNPDAGHSFTYLPDLADAMIRLGASEQALGRAWHVPSLSPAPVRKFVERAAQLAGVATPKVTVTPEIMMRIVGLFVPPARELIEVNYQFKSRFAIDWSDYQTAFGGQSTDVNEALTTTINWWQQELGLSPTQPIAA